MISIESDVMSNSVNDNVSFSVSNADKSSTNRSKKKKEGEKEGDEGEESTNEELETLAEGSYNSSGQSESGPANTQSRSLPPNPSVHSRDGDNTEVEVATGTQITRGQESQSPSPGVLIPAGQTIIDEDESEDDDEDDDEWRLGERTAPASSTRGAALKYKVGKKERLLFEFGSKTTFRDKKNSWQAHVAVKVEIFIRENVWGWLDNK